MAKTFIIEGSAVIIDMRYSKIGYSYPRLFIEGSPTKHINVDLTLGALFIMKEKDWSDWMSDAEHVTAEEAIEGCLFNLEELKSMVKEIQEACKE